MYRPGVISAVHGKCKIMFMSNTWNWMPFNSNLRILSIQSQLMRGWFKNFQLLETPQKSLMQHWYDDLAVIPSFQFSIIESHFNRRRLMLLPRVWLQMVPRPVSWAKSVTSYFKTTTLHLTVSNQSAPSWRSCVRSWKICSRRSVECCTSFWTCLKGCNPSISGATLPLTTSISPEKNPMKMSFLKLDKLIIFSQG